MSAHRARNGADRNTQNDTDAQERRVGVAAPNTSPGGSGCQSKDEGQKQRRVPPKGHAAPPAPVLPGRTPPCPHQGTFFFFTSTLLQITPPRMPPPPAPITPP